MVVDPRDKPGDDSEEDALGKESTKKLMRMCHVHYSALHSFGNALQGQARPGMTLEVSRGARRFTITAIASPRMTSMEKP